MRFRPANIRVINRRNSRLDRDLRCLLRKGGKKKENKEEEKKEKYLTRSFHISVYQRFGHAGFLGLRMPYGRVTFLGRDRVS